MLVFLRLAPILPLIEQGKTELATGSSDIIKSSRTRQMVVFRDDYCPDSIYSMLSKRSLL